jgi:hypothetical protein
MEKGREETSELEFVVLLSRIQLNSKDTMWGAATVISYGTFLTGFMALRKFIHSLPQLLLVIMKVSLYDMLNGSFPCLKWEVGNKLQ